MVSYLDFLNRKMKGLDTAGQVATSNICIPTKNPSLVYNFGRQISRLATG